MYKPGLILVKKDVEELLGIYEEEDVVSEEVLLRLLAIDDEIAMAMTHDTWIDGIMFHSGNYWFDETQHLQLKSEYEIQAPDRDYNKEFLCEWKPEFNSRKSTKRKGKGRHKEARWYE